ncbi:preprotein translocase subunit YajC [Protaetiibacter mangrovi]|uniref:Preprotein translocase subunit YajC n=1 Tax=Protaetiibacter mangrovi TaxID=2970926 RepID=A0ABT1ZBT8_9MICO|nr:preprotein translocase subunit YajC [Protaetiibacter mangrovi]MCS0498172.1 preprotein translocase subunit YajC [Protaetiibacter mangrovi]TPX03713.1 preprotein translocase subunit YajC [Schumannella luteola]
MDYTLILLAGLLVVMIFFTWRSSRKRKAEAENMQTKLVPGAEIMTQHGIFGTLISLDDEKNEAIVETTPGTKLRVHRQTIVRVVDPTELEHADEDVIVDEPETEAVEAEDAATEAVEPEFGERVEKPKRAPRTKPTE